MGSRGGVLADGERGEVSEGGVDWEGERGEREIGRSRARVKVWCLGEIGLV